MFRLIKVIGLGGHEILIAYGMVPQYWLYVTSM